MSQQQRQQQQQKKKKEKGAHNYYDIQGGRLVRHLKKCPRCGVFMAFHKQPKQRWTCGACSYTEYVKTE